MFTSLSQRSKEFSRKKLQDVCRTRWISRILGLETFLEIYKALVKTFEEIYHNEEGKSNRDSVKKAFSFLSLITTFDFIGNHGNTIPSNYFVTKWDNRYITWNEIDNSINGLCSNMRRNIDDYDEKWYKEAILIAGKQNVLEKAPRFWLKQTNRTNQPLSSPWEYYKRSFTIPVIEHLKNAKKN